MQLEINTDPMVDACKLARAYSCPVALKASPLGRGNHSPQNNIAATKLLESGVNLCFVNEWEACTLLDAAGAGDFGEDGLLVTLAHAEAAGRAMLDRWATLQAVVITAVVAHVLIVRRGYRSLSLPPQPNWDGGTGERDVWVLPRVKDDKVADMIGAAE